MPFRTVALTCPSCRSRPTLVDGEPGAHCATCGGWFVEELKLLEQIRAAVPGHPLDELLEHNDGSPRRPCPMCGDRMNIVWLEFIQLDRCDDHGVWLDAGELERSLDWKAKPDDVPRPGNKRASSGALLAIMKIGRR